MDFWFFDSLGYWIYPLLFLMASLAFTFSTVGGGGGAMLLLPFSHYFFGVAHAAPVLNLGNFIGRPARLILFWKYIDWRIVVYYMPAALIGAFVGTHIFSSLRLDWLQIIVAVFLISTIWQFKLGKRKRSFLMKKAYFVPLGFIVSLVSTLVGATGPVMNPFYLNADVDKENLIATKGANSFFMGIVQISGYSFFGELNWVLLGFGAVLGLGAAVGNIIGKQLLKKISKQNFRLIVVLIMVFSGFIILLKQLV